MTGFQAPRGLRDLIGTQAEAHAAIEAAAYAAAESAGYRRIALPIAEESALFERGIGGSSDVIAKELYRIERRGDEESRLALRPEGTAGILRAYIQHGMRSEPHPVRLVTVGPFFRHDRPQKGRYRQFSQFDIEAIGDAGPGIDIEVIELGAAFIRSLGLTDVEVHLNSVGCANCRPAFATAVRAHFASVAAELSDVDRMRLESNPLRILDSKDPVAARLAATAPELTAFLCAECAEHFSGVRAGLDAAQVRTVAAPRLVRGLDYYARTAWEYLLPGELGQQGALGGGGRYDGLAELIGGPATPAIGFAIGIDRLALALEERGIAGAGTPGIEIVVCGLDGADIGRRVAVASTLRDAGLRARADASARKIGRQIEGAARDGALAVIIVEPDGRLTLRDLESGSQGEPAGAAATFAAAKNIVTERRAR